MYSADYCNRSTRRLAALLAITIIGASMLSFLQSILFLLLELLESGSNASQLCARVFTQTKRVSFFLHFVPARYPQSGTHGRTYVHRSCSTQTLPPDRPCHPRRDYYSCYILEDRRVKRPPHVSSIIQVVSGAKKYR